MHTHVWPNLWNMYAGPATWHLNTGQRHGVCMGTDGTSYLLCTYIFGQYLSWSISHQECKAPLLSFCLLQIILWILPSYSLHVFSTSQLWRRQKIYRSTLNTSSRSMKKNYTLVWVKNHYPLVLMLKECANWINRSLLMSHIVEWKPQITTYSRFSI